LGLLRETGLCEEVDQLAEPDDPSDLFGNLQRAGGA
jgi:hypothetical protein